MGSHRYWPVRRVKWSQDSIWIARDTLASSDNQSVEVIMKLSERETNSDYDAENDRIRLEAETLKTLSEQCPTRMIGFIDFYLNDENQYCLIMDRYGEMS